MSLFKTMKILSKTNPSLYFDFIYGDCPLKEIILEGGVQFFNASDIEMGALMHIAGNHDLCGKRVVKSSVNGKNCLRIFYEDLFMALYLSGFKINVLEVYGPSPSKYFDVIWCLEEEYIQYSVLSEKEVGIDIEKFFCADVDYTLALSINRTIHKREDVDEGCLVWTTP